MSAWDDDPNYLVAQRSPEPDVVPVLARRMTYRQAIDKIDEIDPNNELHLYVIHEDALKEAAGKA